MLRTVHGTPAGHTQVQLSWLSRAYSIFHGRTTLLRARSEPSFLRARAVVVRTYVRTCVCVCVCARVRVWMRLWLVVGGRR